MSRRKRAQTGRTSRVGADDALDDIREPTTAMLPSATFTRLASANPMSANLSSTH